MTKKLSAGEKQKRAAEKAVRNLKKRMQKATKRDEVGEKLVKEGVITEEQRQEINQLPEETKVVFKDVLSQRSASTQSDKRPTRVQDGEMTEIIAKVRNLENLLLNGTLEIQDSDGYEDVLEVPSNRNVWRIFYHLDSKKYLNGMEAFDAIPTENKSDELVRLEGKNKYLLFRCIKVEGKLTVWTVVSLKWRKTTIKDIQPTLEEVFPGKIEILDEPTEYHGGRLRVNLGQNDVMQTHAIFDASKLDGCHSIRGSGGAVILSCLNQLTTKVSVRLTKEKLSLPRASFEIRAAHTGNTQLLKEKLQAITSAMETFAEIKAIASNLYLTKSDTQKILDYYVMTADISTKTREKIIALLGDAKLEQEVGTVWGLTMLLTYSGTHSKEMKPGVKESLRRVGGEILIATQQWEPYLEVIRKAPIPKGDKVTLFVTV